MFRSFGRRRVSCGRSADTKADSQFQARELHAGTPIWRQKTQSGCCDFIGSSGRGRQYRLQARAGYSLGSECPESRRRWHAIPVRGARRRGRRAANAKHREVRTFGRHGSWMVIGRSGIRYIRASDRDVEARGRSAAGPELGTGRLSQAVRGGGANGQPGHSAAGPRASLRQQAGFQPPDCHIRSRSRELGCAQQRRGLG